MKQRLTEMQDFRDPDEAEAARLLQSLPPAAPNELAERRVYARISAGPSRRPRLAPVAVLVAALLVSTTILSATLARRWLAGSDQKSSGAPALSLPTAQPKHPPTRREQETSATDQLVSAAQVSTRRDRAREPLTGRRQAVASNDVRGSVEESAARQMASAPPPPEEAALVMAALRSLRREHNPSQAGALAQSYLTRFPQGVLNEEALAIGMEAAVARNDAAVATALANRYLGRYPAGRFVSLAHKTVSAAKP
ncbi:MAG TPA: hypothetical protein VJ860_14795 [Polyangia bacterium]|jgi:hypothetical protein|nr:hypothetical protein [Polyangia bacterium]